MPRALRPNPLQSHGASNLQAEHGSSAATGNEGRPVGRVLCLTSSYPLWQGDSKGSFVSHLAQDLQILGWTVDVVAPHAPGSASEERLDGVAVRRFRYAWPSSLETLCYRSGMLSNLRAAPGNWAKLPAFLLAEWGSVFRHLHTGHYDLLHTHWLLPQGLIGLLTARPLRIPHVVTVHGSDVLALRGRIYSTLNRFTVGQADAVTVNSSATLSAVRAFSPERTVVRQIPMGVSLDVPSRGSAEVVSLRSRHRRGAGPLVLYVGRLMREKGVEDVIRAAAALVGRLPDLTLALVGDGPARSELQVLVGRLELGDRAFFEGWVGHEQIADYMAAADVFVAPSLLEGQGLTVLEAMAAGTPVVTTRVGGIPDMVRHLDTGLLVGAGYPEEIASAIEWLCRNESNCTAMVERARRVVSERYSRAASAARFSELFQDLLAARRSAG